MPCSLNTTVQISCQSSSETVTFRPDDNSRQSTLGKALLLSTKVPRLLWQTGFLEELEDSSWIPLTSKADRISLHGCISLVPSTSRRCQFISLGLQPISNEAGTNILYEEANQIFSNSTFGTDQDSGLQKKSNRQLCSQTYDTDDLTSRLLRSRKSIKRWPMFYLQFDIGEQTIMSVDDALDDRRPILQSIIKLLRATIFEFLKKNYLRPRKMPVRRLEPTKSTLRDWSRRSGCVQTPFDVSHTFRSREPEIQPKDDSDSVQSPTSSISNCKKPLIARASREFIWAPFILRQDKAEIADNSISDKSPKSSMFSENNEVSKWYKPVIESISNTDRRTGFTVSSHSGVWMPQTLRALKAQVLSFPSDLGNTKKPINLYSGSDRAAISWANDLTIYGDPLFNLTSEKCIPALLTESMVLTRPQASMEQAFQTIESRVSRNALCEAEVISQLDTKFIIAKMAPITTSEVRTNGILLVVIDQHAADERRRVEELMKVYHNADTGVAISVMLEHSIRFEITKIEARLFVTYQAALENWGIHYHVLFQRPERLKNSSHRRAIPAKDLIEIVGLPPSISERCKQEPKLIIDLLRKEIYLIQEGNSTSFTSSRHLGLDSESSWLTRFHGCPRGIIEMINTRACRSKNFLCKFIGTETTRFLETDLLLHRCNHV